MGTWRTIKAVAAGLGLATLTACLAPAPADPPAPMSPASPSVTSPHSTAPPPTPAAGTSPRSTDTTTAAARNAPPQIASFTVSPTSVDAPACGGHPPQPVVTVRIVDPDDPPSAIRVRLTYGLTDRYRGEVYMPYSASARAFRYTLPAITAENVGIGEGGNITFNVYVTDPSNAGTRPRLMSEMVSVPICLGTIKNG